jgi:hypothetical protein
MTRVASFILFIRSILFILSEPFLSVADPLCKSVAVFPFPGGMVLSAGMESFRDTHGGL